MRWRGPDKKATAPSCLENQAQGLLIHLRSLRTISLRKTLIPEAPGTLSGGCRLSLDLSLGVSQLREESTDGTSTAPSCSSLTSAVVPRREEGSAQAQ